MEEVKKFLSVYCKMLFVTCIILPVMYVFQNFTTTTNYMLNNFMLLMQKLIILLPIVILYNLFDKSKWVIGLLREKPSGLWFGIGFHFLWNFVQAGIFSFSISGQKIISIFIVDFIKNDFLTGGKYGPEASIEL